MMRNCYFLLAIHLSDNGIMQSDTAGNIADKEFFYDCLEPFLIKEEDLIEIQRSMRNEVKRHPMEKKKYDKLDIDYHAYLNPIFKFEAHKDHA